MPEEISKLELDRWQVMRILRSERYTFPAMIPILNGLGLLDCQDDHRTRVRRDNGESVCVTCENTLLVYWRRGITRMAESYAAMSIEEVKGAWFEDHEFILAICRDKAIRKAGSKTTRTSVITESVDGKEVVTQHTITTEKEEWRVDGGLLRLLGDVRDKIARQGGMNIDKPALSGQVPEIEIHFHEENDNDGDSGITN